MQAFVGVAHDLNSIIIAFRGTQEQRYESQNSWLSITQVHGITIVSYPQ